jgi:hypothetical protein
MLRADADALEEKAMGTGTSGPPSRLISIGSVAAPSTCPAPDLRSTRSTSRRTVLAGGFEPDPDRRSIPSPSTTAAARLSYGGASRRSRSGRSPALGRRGHAVGVTRARPDSPSSMAAAGT